MGFNSEFKGLIETEFSFAEGVTDGHIDRHKEANSRFSQFCERPIKSKYFLVPTNLNDLLFYRRDRMSLLRVTKRIFKFY